MAKWSKDELLCNARGLDDGYLYMYHKHPFGKKLAKLTLSGSKTAASPKERLADSASYGFAGFTGSVRPPLSNELHAVGDAGDAARVPLPSTASKIDRVSHDNLFVELIDANEAVCVAFSEPRKYSHKSIILAGANLLPSKLTAEDMRIRRPKLNRFGGTIANLGMSRSGGGQSHQSGYGSMNISSYERELAQRTGRGHEMYQPGTRQWGAMEPTPKRHRTEIHSHQHAPGYGGQNPFSTQHREAAPSQQHVPRPPWQNTGPGPQNPIQHGRWQPPSSSGGLPHQPPPPQRQYGHQHQQQRQMHHSNYHHPGRSNSNAGQPPHQQQRYIEQQAQRPQGYNFQAFAQQQQQSVVRPRNDARPPPPQQRPGAGRADGNVMNSLRAQLVSTLKQNRRPGQGNDKGQ
jgi:hypothetical protein